MILIILCNIPDELFKVHKLKPTPQWRQRFDSYIKAMPGYYAQPLKRALARMGAHNLVPDSMDNCLSYSVITYLKKLKNQVINWRIFSCCEMQVENVVPRVTVE